MAKVPASNASYSIHFACHLFNLGSCRFFEKERRTENLLILQERGKLQDIEVVNFIRLQTAVKPYDGCGFAEFKIHR